MRTIVARLVVGSSAILLWTATARAVTPEQRCEAYQLAATGQRISAKLHCRAWAELSGTAVDPACLDKAEKRFLLQLQDGGPDCAAPDDVVSLGAAADAQASAVVADVQPSAPTIPSLTGHWITRTRVATNEAGTVLGCEFYQSRPCPTPDFFALLQCDTRLEQTGTALTFDSTCSTPPESGLQLASFAQAGTGTVDRVTGEWLLTGTVEVPGLAFPIEYQGEGVFSADGRTQTGFTTAGWSGRGGQTLWLATTTGERVE
jgi:hypothetical protein